MTRPGAFSRIREKFEETHLFRRRKQQIIPPTLTDVTRFPYGPFRFKAHLPKGTACTILASTDAIHWHALASVTAPAEGLEYVDSEASKFSHRFYRLLLPLTLLDIRFENCSRG